MSENRTGGGGLTHTVYIRSIYRLQYSFLLWKYTSPVSIHSSPPSGMIRRRPMQPLADASSFRTHIYI